MDEMRGIRLAFPTPEKLFTRGVTIIVALLVAGFLGLSLAPQVVGGALALSPLGVLHGKIWQLVTYPFLNGPWGLVWNGLLVLFVGSSIEREWRTASFLWLWFIVSVVCGVLWILVNLLMNYSVTGFGAGACSYGIIAVMGVLFRHRRYLVFFATMEAQHIAIGLIAIGVVLSLPNPITLVWVAGALVGYVYLKARWSLQARPAARSRAGRSGGKGQFIDID
jgi:membrane associated rhomboid family serine protease